MAKRMKFSVVGLPHYTIWHLYEPSVDDIRHMEEMDRDRKKKEAEEAAKKERENKIKDTFDSKGDDWKKDKEAVEDLVKQAKNEAAQQEKPAEPKQENKVAEQPKQNDKIQEARGADEKPKPQPAQ
jgi:mannan polymerase II complex ANP1 subunit